YKDLIRGDWFEPKGRPHHTGAVYLNGDWLIEASKLDEVLNFSGTPAWLKEAGLGAPTAQLWFAQVDATNTAIWAQFKGVNPNEQNVEINVRQTVFYPGEPGRNFITVRGFVMEQAATPWAPPTAEQIALVGTHWSKGWIIESNVVRYSICSGISLGKYGDRWDNTSANSAEGYVETIKRALANGWNRDTIGHHLVRNNVISHCEQAGIVGSLGAAFSTVTGNHISDIHVRRLFTGAEMAGIKFHAAIDTVIRNNDIERTCLGLWLDWMAQGTRVSANLFHDNGRDLFVEVNHGPFVVDNNLFLSGANLLDMSEGGAYAHNLFNGTIINSPELNRQTPYHPAHSTSIAGLANVKGGDCRFYNNLFVGRGGTSANDSGCGLASYNRREVPLQTGGNVFYCGAQPYAHESNGTVTSTFDPQLKLLRQNDRLSLRFNPGIDLKQSKTRPVETARLGKAQVSGLPYENADGSPFKVDLDFLGQPRSKSTPTPGPFEHPKSARLILPGRGLAGLTN
ncbi:MAG TPA: right-handed parallel beta-helix repeat-containing protein, partial [Verrucomicrobiae bacterium]|nr:right-handed parallel beta-helix repeat-containing protein [Verrucomicrobiae bacterium]